MLPWRVDASAHKMSPWQIDPGYYVIFSLETNLFQRNQKKNISNRLLLAKTFKEEKPKKRRANENGEA